MKKGCILARAPGGQMQGAATQAMRCHRRGAATPQMPARRRAPLGCGPGGRQQIANVILRRALSPHFSVRRERRRFSVGESPTRQLSLRPVAIGAAVEAMKPLKPLVEGITVGDSAIMQAVT